MRKARADWRNGKGFIGKNRGGAGLVIKEAGRNLKGGAKLRRRNLLERTILVGLERRQG